MAPFLAFGHPPPITGGGIVVGPSALISPPLVIGGGAGVGAKKETKKMPTELAALIEEQRNAVKDLEREGALASWEANITSSPEAEARAASFDAQLMRCYSDSGRYAKLKALNAEG